MYLRIIQNRNIFFALSSFFVIVSIVALSMWGLSPGIDFTGGSLLEISFSGNRPTTNEVSDVIMNASLGIEEVKVQPTEKNEFLIRLRELDEEEHQTLLSEIKKAFSGQEIVENRFESIGPIIGKELREKAWVAIAIAIIVIILYITISFRHVSKPVSSWKYGISAIITLIHDVMIVIGAFAALGYFYNVEVGILFVTALLTVLGYSVNDTIVVFDRVRENLIYRPRETFVETVNHSVNETIKRSINTSFTTLLVLFSLYFLGGSTIREFVLVLILGTIFGTYSSIFVASPLLVVWQKMRK